MEDNIALLSQQITEVAKKNDSPKLKNALLFVCVS